VHGWTYQWHGLTYQWVDTCVHGWTGTGLCVCVGGGGGGVGPHGLSVGALRVGACARTWVRVRACWACCRVGVVWAYCRKLCLLARRIRQ
jgi:hypothetical protein